jgi:hypothetical protein
MEFENISELNLNSSANEEDELIVEGYSVTSRISLANIKKEIDKIIPADGPSGPKGHPGEKGATGPSGYKGLSGDLGSRGIHGQTGRKGIRGSSGESAQPGEPGTHGEQGPKGPTGPKGFNGHQGLQGKRGIQGPPAENGATGILGIPGSKGVRGDPGENGDMGESVSINQHKFPGAKGEKGNPGTSGLRGDPGEVGISGRPGAKGKQGKLGPRATRKNKVDYPVYGAKLRRSWVSIWDLGLTEDHVGLDYLTKKDYLTDDYKKLKYKFIKVVFKPSDDYISDNVVEVASPLTCILMIPGKLSRWSPVVYGAPPLVWYKRATDQRNNRHMRHIQRQAAQIYVDTENSIANESVWPDDKIRFTIQKPRQEFGVNVNPESGEFKILAIYGTNDL